MVETLSHFCGLWIWNLSLCHPAILPRGALDCGNARRTLCARTSRGLSTAGTLLLEPDWTRRRTTYIGHIMQDREFCLEDFFSHVWWEKKLETEILQILAMLGRLCRQTKRGITKFYKVHVFEVSQHCTVCSFLAAFHLFQNHSNMFIYCIHAKMDRVWDQLSNWTRPRRMHKHRSGSSGHRNAASKAEVRSHNAWTMNKTCLLTAHNIQNTWLKSQSMQLMRSNEKSIWIQTQQGDVEPTKHLISIVHLGIHNSENLEC